MVDIVATRNPADTFGFVDLLHHDPFFPYRIRFDKGNDYMLWGRGWQVASHYNYTSLDVDYDPVFCDCFVRRRWYGRVNEKGTNDIDMMMENQIESCAVNKIGERSKDCLCTYVWMWYTYKKSVVCSKCKHCIIRDYIFEKGKVSDETLYMILQRYTRGFHYH